MNKSAPAPRRQPSNALLADVFTHAPVALVILDEALRIVAINENFAKLAGTRELAGEDLPTMLGIDEASRAAPADGHELVWEGRLHNRACLARVSRRGATLVAVLESAAQRREEEILLALGREISTAESEDALVGALSRALRALFPARCFCVRIVDPANLTLTSLHAEGKLIDGSERVLRLRKSAARKAGLALAELEGQPVELVEIDAPIFVGTKTAQAVPLVCSGKLFGLVNVEHDSAAPPDPDHDDRVLILVANTAAVGIRNAKLIEELTFVKGYLEDLLENANALILVTNRERRVIVFNRAMAQLSGRAREDVIGRDFLDFVPDSERTRLSLLISESLRGNAVSNFETRLLGPNGAELRVAFSTAAVPSASGEVDGVIAIGQDLTRLEKLERRIVQADKLASLGQIAAGVVHEINNPLTAIVIGAEALHARFALDPQARVEADRARRIIENGQRILRFARDLISYARPSSDRIESTDVREILEQAIVYCEHELSGSGARIERDFAEVPLVPVMRTNLTQVFVNLITNACHAIRADGKVTLRTRTLPESLEVEVSDEGVGIAPESLSQIFEPFFTTKTDGKGTGLGLSIVSDIVARHGGVLDVRSVVGEGTTFTIRLPIVRAPIR